MTTSSTSITIKLAADGKNWRDWNKQLVNCASADNAFSVLSGSARPQFDSTDDQYKLTILFRPDYQVGATPEAIITETDRVGKLNKTIRAINDEARAIKKEDEDKYTRWVARDARLQNTILSSIEKPLVAMIRMCTTAFDMHKTLQDLNSNGDYANAAAAWEAFVDLRADTQPTIRAYIGKFREAINDLTVQSLSIDWQRPLTAGGLVTSRVEELRIIHFLHGLGRVLPQWVEARNNDLRQGQSWTIDTLIASLEDHIRHTPEEPVKAFLTVAKQAEEKRVLTRLSKNGKKPATTPTLATSSAPGRNNNGQPKRVPTTVGMCNHCQREHAGPNEKCWKAHPELTPDSIKKRNQETAAKKAATAAAATASRTHVTTALTDDHARDDRYSAHVYTTINSIASAFVSPTLLKKAVTNQDYKQRYCYDTAAN